MTSSEAFYLGTKGGGAFFGKVGSFEEGYELDALVIDDSSLMCGDRLSLEERIQNLYILVMIEILFIDMYVEMKFGNLSRHKFSPPML